MATRQYDQLRLGFVTRTARGGKFVAKAFCALLLHTLVYAAFLEDPLTWTLLAMAAALRRVDPEGAAAVRPPQAARAAA